MNTNRKHSPERVREYFNLLEWYNNSDRTLPQELLDLDEILISYRNSLKYVTKNIEFISLGLISLEAQFKSLVDKLKNLERDLTSKKVEISDLSKLVTNIDPQEITNRVNSTDIPRNTFSHRKPSFLKIVCSILLSIIFDLKASNLFSRKAIRKVLPQFFFIYISTIVILRIGFNIISNWRYSSALQVFWLSYFLAISILIFTLGEILFGYIVEKYKESFLLSISRDLKKRKRNEEKSPREIYKTVEPSEKDLNFRRLISEKDELDSHHKTTKKEYSITQFRIQQLQIEIDKNKAAIQDYEILISERTSELMDLRYQHLNQLQEDVKNWLCDGISDTSKKAMKKLHIPELTDQSRSYFLKNTPLQLLTGIIKPALDKDNNIRSYIVESDSNRNLETVSEENIFISKNDYLNGTMYESSTKMYGVYEFVVIFLCSNFLTYYRCYFNLVRNLLVDEENCEYLYDSIISVKVQDKSSTGLSDNSQKRIYRKRLFITTADGNVVCFNILQNRIPGLSIKLVDVDYAASAIRKMLRQRRIDFVRIVDKNEP